MTEVAKSGRPPWAITCWVDDFAVFTEVPCKSGPPLIQKYSLSESGLSRALAFLRAMHLEARPNGGTYKIGVQANITKPGPKVSEETREKARAVLKRAGIIS